MGIKKEKSFPRGGVLRTKSDVSSAPKEKRPAKKEKDLFAVNDAAKVVKKLKKKPNKKVRDKRDQDDDGGLKVKSIDPLTYEKLSENLKVLGRISEIRDLELKLSLPGRLVAFVPITKISSSYTEALKKITESPEVSIEALGVKTLQEVFHEGQLVICSIVSVEKGENDFYKVTASLNPTQVNEDLKIGKGSVVMSAIKSIEDHGYMCDVGKSSLKAFLPVKKAPSKLSIGQVIPTLVTKIDGSAVVLSGKLGSTNVTDVDKVSVHNMCPGMVFNTVVEKNMKNGMKMKFGDFSGYVHVSHFQDDLDEGQSVQATLLYVLPTVNFIYLSLQNDLKFNEPIEKLSEKVVKVGDLAKDCTVLEADHRGLVINFKQDEDKKCTGVVPMRHLTENMRKDFKALVNTKVNARVLQYDYFDQVFVCSMQKSLLEQNIVKLDQLKPGENLTVKAKRFANKGLVVEVGRNLDGFIPSIHLSDIPLKNPEKKIKIGEKLKVKVLKVEPSKKRIHLTNKRLLVEKTDYTMIDGFDEKFVHEISEGVVVQVSSEGVLLQFFNDICGFVPKSKISIEPVEYPEKLFFHGQVLKCKVLDVNPDKRRMTLTLILTEEKMAPLGSKQKKMHDGAGIKRGLFYENIKICDKTSEGLGVEVNGIKALIPKNHLSDHVTMADKLLRVYKVNDIIPRARCFEKDVLPILSIKTSIMEFEDSNITFDELHEGQVFPLVVSNIKPYGIFVKLPVWTIRKSGLIPLRHLSDTFVEDPNEFVQLHQTIYGKVLETNEKEQKFTLTSKCKELRNSDTANLEHLSGITISMLNDVQLVKQRDSHPDLSMYSVGDVVNTTVNDISEFGLDTSIDGKTRAIIPRASLYGLEEPTKGQTVAGVILYIDYDFGVVEMTLQSDIIKAVLKPKKSAKLHEGQNVKAVCVLKRTESQLATFCVKTPRHCQGQMIYVPMRTHLNDFEGFGDAFNLHETYDITVLKISDVGIVGVFNKSFKSGQRLQKRQRLDSSMSEDQKEQGERKKARLDSQSSENEHDSQATAIKEESEVNHQQDPTWEKDFNPWGTGTLGTEEVSAAKKSTNEDETSNADNKKATKTHLSKKEKKELERLEELAIKEAEKRVIEGQDVPPESVDEFDRLVLASPDSSLCWIQYVAFHTERKAYDSAREVIKRALSKINFREETERFNVYIAWLNLELHFGSEEDADKVFKEAVQCNDEFKVYEKAASIYMQSDKHEKAEKLYKLMARKFSKELNVWLLLGEFYYKTNNLKEARFTLQRSLQFLSKKSESVQVSSKFAQYEFQYGEAERGKSIFEYIVRDFPARIDQWCVYVDMVIKKGEIETAREIFERMIHLGLGPKRMKSLFKKYCEFEQTHGDEVKVDAVRKKALEYLEKQNVKVNDEDDPMDQMEAC